MNDISHFKQLLSQVDVIFVILENSLLLQFKLSTNQTMYCVNNI